MPKLRKSYQKLTHSTSHLCRWRHWQSCKEKYGHGLQQTQQWRIQDRNSYQPIRVHQGTFRDLSAQAPDSRVRR